LRDQAIYLSEALVPTEKLITVFLWLDACISMDRS